MMRKPGLVFSALFVLSLACSAVTGGQETAPVSAAPRLPTVAPEPEPSSEPPLDFFSVERFSGGVGDWQLSAPREEMSDLRGDADLGLLWTLDAKSQEAAAIYRAWPDLSAAGGLKISLTSLDRSVYLLLTVTEKDGSAYNLVLPLGKGETAAYTLSFAEFGLDESSKDENNRLDSGELAVIGLADITPFLEKPAPNRVAIREIGLWKGTLVSARFSPLCPGEVTNPADGVFRTGVDANFVSQADQLRKAYWAGEERVDPLELLSVNGADAFRVRLWVGEEGESKFAYASDLALRAQQAGLRPYLVLFLSEEWADVNKQPAPSAWATLALEDRAAAIRKYAADTVRRFLEKGITPDFYEIGNEIDYGISGVFADTSQARDAASLREGVWREEAALIQAAVLGVREADPDARFLLHIATIWQPEFSLAFFQSMEEFGVEYDYLGLSYYPNAFGSPTVGRFCATLDLLQKEIGKPVVIAETAYAAEQAMEGMFMSWRHPIIGYPLTPEGQAWWLADFFAAMRNRGDVAGVYVFSPELWFNQEVWGPFALFDKNGRARPGIASFQTPTP